MRQAGALKSLKRLLAQLGDLAGAGQPITRGGEDVAPPRAASRSLPKQCSSQIPSRASGRVFELRVTGRFKLQRQFLAAALHDPPFDITCTKSGTM